MPPKWSAPSGSDVDDLTSIFSEYDLIAPIADLPDGREDFVYLGHLANHLSFGPIGQALLNLLLALIVDRLAVFAGCSICLSFSASL